MSQRPQTPLQLPRQHLNVNANILSANFYGFPKSRNILTIGEYHTSYSDQCSFKNNKMTQDTYKDSKLESFLYSFQRFSFDYKKKIILLYEANTYWPSPKYEDNKDCSLLNLVANSCNSGTPSEFFTCLNIDSREFCFLAQSLSNPTKSDEKLERTFYILPEIDQTVQVLKTHFTPLVNEIREHYPIAEKSAIFKIFKLMVSISASVPLPSNALEVNLDELINHCCAKLHIVDPNRHLKLFIILLIIESFQQNYLWITSSNYLETLATHVNQYLKIALPHANVNELQKIKLILLAKTADQILNLKWPQYIEAPFFHKNYPQMRTEMLKELKSATPILSDFAHYATTFVQILNFGYWVIAFMPALELTFCGIWLLSKDIMNIVAITGGAHTRKLNSIIHLLPRAKNELCAKTCNYDYTQKTYTANQIYSDLQILKMFCFESSLDEKKSLDKYIN